MSRNLADRVGDMAALVARPEPGAQPVLNEHPPAPEKSIPPSNQHPATRAKPTRGRSSAAVCLEAGISYRQLDYWCRSRAIPGQEIGTGSGSSRRFTDEQVDVIKRLAALARVRGRTLAELYQLVAGGLCPCCERSMAS